MRLQVCSQNTARLVNNTQTVPIANICFIVCCFVSVPANYACYWLECSLRWTMIIRVLSARVAMTEYNIICEQLQFATHK